MLLLLNKLLVYDPSGTSTHKSLCPFYNSSIKDLESDYPESEFWCGVGVGDFLLKDTPTPGVKKAEHLYSDLHGNQTILKRSKMDHAV